MLSISYPNIVASHAFRPADFKQLAKGQAPVEPHLDNQTIIIRRKPNNEKQNNSFPNF